MTAQQAGALTLGYAVAIIAFIRVGEKLLQRFGARKPMIWGCLITGLVHRPAVPGQPDAGRLQGAGDDRLHPVRGRPGLLRHAPPPTPPCRACRRRRAGSGAGIYKMASSSCAAFGVAISAAIFTALSANPEKVSPGWRA